MKNKITREELIEEVKRVGDKLEKSPTKDEFEDHGKYSVGPYNKRFDSWSTVLEKADFPPNRRFDVTKNALLAEIERLHNETGEIPTTSILREQGRYSMYLFYKHFDSWNAALQKCDFEPQTGGIVYTKDELISELLRLNDELGHTPSAEDMAELGCFSPQPYKHHFGKWNNALIEAGLDPNCLINIPRQELLDELYRVYNRLDRSPLRAEFAEMSCYSAEPYKGTFGSWNDALRSADLPLNKRDKIPQEELINDLIRVSEKIGETPTREQMKRFGQFFPSIYSKRFGTWNNAIRKANLEPVIELNISRSELMEHLGDLINNLGYVPTQEELHEYGDYSAQPYRRAFGTWNNAIRELGYQPPHTWKESEEYYRYYGKNWQNQRQKRIDLDQYECRKCNCSQNEHYQQYETDLHVHHITKFVRFDNYKQANQLTNLVTLCQDCHSMLEGKPKKFFIPLAPPDSLTSGSSPPEIEVSSTGNNYTIDEFT